MNFGGVVLIFFRHDWIFLVGAYIGKTWCSGDGCIDDVDMDM